MLGCFTETKASGNSGKWWLKNQPNFRRLQFHVRYFQNRYVKIKFYYHWFSISVKWENSFSLQTFEWRLIFHWFCEDTFNICISNSVRQFFLFQRSKYVETLIAWLFSFCSSCMACPLLHCHLFSHYSLIKKSMPYFAAWLSS